MGTLSVTAGGKTCQSWSSQTPHEQPYTFGNMFPDGEMSLVKNYCRNPSDYSDGPWCYTTDPNITWQYCDIPTCDTSKTIHDYFFHVNFCQFKRNVQEFSEI